MSEIGSTEGSTCQTYCYGPAGNGFDSKIRLRSNDLLSNDKPLAIKILKQTVGGKINMVMNARLYFAHRKQAVDDDGSASSTRMAEIVSGALEVYVENQAADFNDSNKPAIVQSDIDFYYKGGTIYQ